jgi:hypothetical protein
VFCLGQARAAALAQQGFAHVGYDTDLNAIINYSSSTAVELSGKASWVAGAGPEEV